MITASAGNHGYGLATAGRKLGVDVTVFCARSVPEVKRAGIAGAGARLELVDADGYDEVEARAKAVAAERAARFVSPFDDPYVAAGNGGTLALEIVEDLPDVATIVAPVGGGGLIAGLAGARRLRGSSFRLVGVQSEACPSMVESVRQGRPLLTFEGGPTVAEGLQGGVSPTTFRVARDELEEMVLVPETALEAAMVFAETELELVIEGSAAPPLAWWRERPRAKGKCVLIVSGRNVDPARLAALRAAHSMTGAGMTPGPPS